MISGKVCTVGDPKLFWVINLSLSLAVVLEPLDTPRFLSLDKLSFGPASLSTHPQNYIPSLCKHFEGMDYTHDFAVVFSSPHFPGLPSPRLYRNCSYCDHQLWITKALWGTGCCCLLPQGFLMWLSPYSLCSLLAPLPQRTPRKEFPRAHPQLPFWTPVLSFGVILPTFGVSAATYLLLMILK